MRFWLFSYFSWLVCIALFSAVLFALASREKRAFLCVQSDDLKFQIGFPISNWPLALRGFSVGQVNLEVSSALLRNTVVSFIPYAN